MPGRDYSQLNCLKIQQTSVFKSYRFNKILFTVLFVLYFSLSLTNYMWPHIYKNIIVTIIGLFVCVFLCARLKRKYTAIYLFVGLLVAFFLISSLFVDRTGPRLYSPIVFIICNFGIALLLIRRYVYNWGAYIVFYGLSGYFLFAMLTGRDVASVLITAPNFISTIMIISCVVLYITTYIWNKKVSLIPALVTFLFSIWGLGRAGIAASLILLLGVLFIKLRANRKHLYLMVVALFVLSMLTSWSLNDLYTFVSRYSIFKDAVDHNIQRWTRAVPDPRFTYWENYFNNLDLSRIIFGVNVIKDPWPDGEINEYNYHNSFIHLHLQTGIMGLITMVLILYSLLKSYKLNKLFFFLLSTLIFRSFYDSPIFFGRFDFVIFFFIFYYIQHIRFRSKYEKLHHSLR